VVVAEAIREELLEHAREEAPNEACGLVVLRDDTAVRYERGRNAAASPYRFRLEVDPEVWFLEDEGYQLAVFHSHPTSPPRPSRTDLAQIGLWEGRPYLILRVDTGELAAWSITDGTAEEAPLSA
jgi:proteasome lid subunit RPN8/RPN11